MKFTPTHYWIGFVPCITSPEEDTCKDIEFEPNTIEVYGLDRLNELNQELKKYWFGSTVIPINQLEDFLNQMEDVK